MKLWWRSREVEVSGPVEGAGGSVGPRLKFNQVVRAREKYCCPVVSPKKYGLLPTAMARR